MLRRLFSMLSRQCCKEAESWSLELWAMPSLIIRVWMLLSSGNREQRTSTVPSWVRECLCHVLAAMATTVTGPRSVWHTQQGPRSRWAATFFAMNVLKLENQLSTEHVTQWSTRWQHCLVHCQHNGTNNKTGHGVLREDYVTMHIK